MDEFSKLVSSRNLVASRAFITTFSLNQITLQARAAAAAKAAVVAVAGAVGGARHLRIEAGCAVVDAVILNPQLYTLHRALYTLIPTTLTLTPQHCASKRGVQWWMR